MYIETILPMNQAGLISAEEAHHAFLAEYAGSEQHTLGYELEVLPSAARQLAGPDYDDEMMKFQCIDFTSRYGFSISYDGVYEIGSPVSAHPFPQAIATRVLANAGLLPFENHGVINAHVSIGTKYDFGELNRNGREDMILPRTLLLLRTVEQMSTTTANRLMLPERYYKKSASNNIDDLEGSWACKGLGGVGLEDRSQIASDHWQGNLNRMELRTLGYYSPQQFAKTLDLVHTLSSGLLAEAGTPAEDIYSRFEAELHQYFDDHGLLTLRNQDPDELAGDFANVPVLLQYMRPFAEHLRSVDKSVLQSLVNQAMADLKEEHGLAGFDYMPQAA